MTTLQAFILGIIQGLTEFLPISSTAHLTLAGKFFGLVNESHPEHWTAFIAVIQLGTLVAVISYFTKDIYKITKGFFVDVINRITGKQDDTYNMEAKMGWLIILGTLPVVFFGLFFKDAIEGTLTKNLYVIAGSMVVLAVLLWIAEIVGKRNRDIEQIGVWDSLIIGFAQALALIPGSSRSGTTITAGLFTGLKRDVAAKFSFLLSLPAVFASGVFELLQIWNEIPQAGGTLQLIVATIVSAVSGYLAIAFLIGYLKTHSTYVFIIYRIVVGILIFYLLFSNYIKP